MHQAETSAGKPGGLARQRGQAGPSEGAGWPITGGRNEMNLISVLYEYVRDLM